MHIFKSKCQKTPIAIHRMKIYRIDTEQRINYKRKDSDIQEIRTCVEESSIHTGCELKGEHKEKEIHHKHKIRRKDNSKEKQTSIIRRALRYLTNSTCRQGRAEKGMYACMHRKGMTTRKNLF